MAQSALALSDMSNTQENHTNEGGTQQDSSDNGDILGSTLGKLSLNVQAMPYIPKQDGSAFVPNDGDTSRSEAEQGSKQTENGATANKLSAENSSENVINEELQSQREIMVLKQNLKHYEEIIDQYQASEQTRKREVDSALISAREVVERERREKMDVLSDRKSRQEQFEQLTKTLGILQAENEELQKLRRQQDEKLTELTRLKTLIQENGFPNIEQFLMLQKQIESFRDDFFNERKERERLQSQKDKLKRDFDAAQCRIASLQEQVYKYREHIFFIQNKFKQPTSFRPFPSYDTGTTRTSATEACKLYGPNATQYINHSLTPTNTPASGGTGSDPKFLPRSDKKNFPGRYSDGQTRQWQDGRMVRPASTSDEWRTQQQQQQQQSSRNGYFHNVNRLTSSSSAPSLSPMVTAEQSDAAFYEKQFGKPGFPRRPRSSLADDTNKDFTMPPGDWSKQSKQGKRFPSPLASPNLLASPAAELWSPQQGPRLGFQKGWQNTHDEIFRFPPSPLSTPTSKGTFDSWPTPSTTEDHTAFTASTTIAGEDSNFLPLTMPSPGRKDGNFARFSQSNTINNGLLYVCYNCGINFDDNEAHRNHVETCGL